MATIADQLTHLSTTKEKIRTAIVAKGVAVPTTTPFRQYADKIAAIPQEGGGSTEIIDYGWERPANRPALPFDGEPDDNNIWMLYGVSSTGVSDMAFQLTCVGGYYVDWGDGTIDATNSAAKCEHAYDYSTISTTPDVSGIKWVWIKFYPQTAGNDFTVILHNVRPSNRPTASSTAIYSPRVYEIYLKATQVIVWTWSSSTYTRYCTCNVLYWYGENKITTYAYWCRYWYALKAFKAYTSLSTSFTYFLSNCTSFNSALSIDTSKGSSFTYAFEIMPAMAHPIIVDLSSALSGIGTSFIRTNSYLLPSIRLLNMGSAQIAFNFSYSALSASDLETLFNDLYDRSSTTAGAIDITGVAGASALTAAQRAIATNKNWTITG